MRKRNTKTPDTGDQTVYLDCLTIRTYGVIQCACFHLYLCTGKLYIIIMRKFHYTYKRMAKDQICITNEHLLVMFSN